MITVASCLLFQDAKPMNHNHSLQTNVQHVKACDIFVNSARAVPTLYKLKQINKRSTNQAKWVKYIISFKTKMRGIMDTQKEGQ